MPYNIRTLYFRLPYYFHVSNSALVFTYYYITLTLHRRSLNFELSWPTICLLDRGASVTVNRVRMSSFYSVLSGLKERVMYV